MVIALVNPPNSATLGYDGENSTPPLGLAYLASVLRGQSYHVDIFDLAEHAPIDITELQEKNFFSYDLYGFTSYTKTFPTALQLLAILKEHNPGCIIVFGGPHVSSNSSQILEENCTIDFILKKEGEYSLLDLVRSLTNQNKEALRQIPGLVYRTRGHGSIATSGILENDCTELKEIPLDSLPYPVRDYVIQPTRNIEEGRRHSSPVRVEFFSSSRGCVKKCEFCSIIVMSSKYRFRSVNSLLQEIKTIYAKNPFGHICFLDANFFVHYKRTLDFSKSLHAWNPAITWSGTATADSIVQHREIIKEIGRLNCSYLEVGIESGSQLALNRFSKWTTVDQNSEALDLLQKSNIEINLDFIMFDPEVTLDELEENLDFFKRNELYGTYPIEHLYNSLKIYPGTKSRSKYVKMFSLREHHLMNLMPPFVHKEVDIVYRLNHTFFIRYQSVISSYLTSSTHFINTQNSIYSYNTESTQYLNYLIIRLKHFPYKLFELILDNTRKNIFHDGTSFSDIETLGCLVPLQLIFKKMDNILNNDIQHSNIDGPVHSIPM
jgi:anaerobic magnesium-protoporphyrin IX monomethyl ester cyclase